MIKKPRKGELMVGAAIVGVLTSLAVPEYQTYVAKTKLTSVLASASAGDKTILDYYINEGKMPAYEDMRKPGTALSVLYKTLATGEYTTGQFTRSAENEVLFDLTLRNIKGNLDGRKIALSYRDNGNHMKVTCVTKEYIPSKYLPKECV